MKWNQDSILQKRVNQLIEKLEFGYINSKRVVVFKSAGSKARAYARIWGFPRIWQQALDLKPHYCLEVISEKFDRLTFDDQNRVLIHELLHIPKNFSGALLSHKGVKRRIDSKAVEKLYKQVRKK
ncbi:MAG: putative metallopeptidase [Patescibacteria group bacterium]|nr:metallopeptidase [Patescibacteria group bacterium]